MVPVSEWVSARGMLSLPSSDRASFAATASAAFGMAREKSRLWVKKIETK